MQNSLIYYCGEESMIHQHAIPTRNKGKFEKNIFMTIILAYVCRKNIHDNYWASANVNKNSHDENIQDNYLS